MKYSVSEISLRADEYGNSEKLEENIRSGLIRKIKKIISGRPVSFDPEHIGEITILRQSVDARKKPDVRAVFTLAFESDEELPLNRYEEQRYEPPACPAEKPGQMKSPVIAGFGPCGMFAALVLASAGASPLVIERGRVMEERIADVEDFWNGGSLDPESNVQFGEGGAGTFSDGKLTTGIKNIRIGWILEQFIESGADPSIRYRAKPHIGTDRLRRIVPRIRKKIEELGGQVLFSTRLDGIEQEDGRLRAVITSQGRIETDVLILATGHSADDTLRMLHGEGLEMKPKPFSIGFRIEHPQEDINRAQYADPALAEIFGPAEYKLSTRCENGRGVYTFCMCPGGQVVNASSEEGCAVTNGMSYMARGGRYANSGLLVDVRVEDFERGDDPLAGIAFQKKYERIAWEEGRKQSKAHGDGLPSSTYGRFRDDEEDGLRKCIPGFATESIIEAMPVLGRKLSGFDSEEAVLKAVETRSSSPVRIIRDEKMNSTVKGIIPAGEGPGYAGGIMSAALDGIRAAEAVLEGMAMCDTEEE